MKIPKHWVTIPLKQLVIAQKGKKPLKLSQRYFPDSVPYLDIEAVEKGNINQYADPYSTVLATEQDIFVVADGSRSGLVAKGMTGAVGSTIICLSPLGINQLYLFYFLKLNFDYLNNNTTGASIPHLNQELFYSLDVPVPPLAEQETIVVELEKKLKDYQNNFNDAENELARIIKYKSSILEQAVTGQLTQIMIDNSELNSPKRSFLSYSIPANWESITLSEIASSITDGDHQSTKKVKDGVPFILISNISNGIINFENVSYVSETYYEALKESRKPRRGDLLLTIVGTIGNVVLITNEPKFCFQRHIALIRPNEKCNSKYLFYLLNSSIFYKQAIERAKGVAQQTLNLSELRNIQIPLPSIYEQKEIVLIVDKLLHDIELIEKEHSGKIHDVYRLQQSVLQMAFNGFLSKSINEEKHWYPKFLQMVEFEKERKISQLAESKTGKISKFQKLKKDMSEKKDIKQILKDAPDHSLPVVDVWKQSVFYEKANIEGFYEALEKLMNSPDPLKGDVVFNFADEEKMLGVLKLRIHAD